MIKICDECGKPFEARSTTTRFCKGPHIQICAVCGKSFEYTCTPLDKPATCSKECRKIYKARQLEMKYGAGITNVSQITAVREKKKVSNASATAQQKSRATCLARYGVEHVMQDADIRAKQQATCATDEVREKRRRTFQTHFGVDHVFMSPEYRATYGCNRVSQSDKVKRTVIKRLLEKYGVTCIANIPGVAERAQQSREATVMERYGENCVFKTKQFKQHIMSTYGVSNVMKDRAVMGKAMRNKQRTSALEIRLHHFLEAYNIDYIDEYVIKDGDLIHSFDVYIPKYKILIDCDGVYWHSYLSDPDGDRVREDGDPVRLALVPSDHIFYLIVESDFERGLRGLQKILLGIDADIFDYDTELFNWCRRVGFPYYNYSAARMLSDYNQLCNYHTAVYNENCRFGLSLINHFHPSIFDAHTQGEPSPKEAWYNDTLLKRVIANRLIYVNEVNPSKVLQGFNISKTAPKVSVFNPILAKYLCDKYGQEFVTVIDPFSGFSGRLLGCVAAGKQYTGKDLSATHIDESRQLQQFIQDTTASLVVEDILASDDVETYDCLLTCPPYGVKETYGEETEFRCCDEWIDRCLARYQCKRYIFVVDTTSKYSSYIVEELKSKSHFRRSSEYVVVIDS